MRCIVNTIYGEEQQVSRRCLEQMGDKSDAEIVRLGYIPESVRDEYRRVFGSKAMSYVSVAVRVCSVDGVDLGPYVCGEVDTGNGVTRSGGTVDVYKESGNYVRTWRINVYPDMRVDVRSDCIDRYEIREPSHDPVQCIFPDIAADEVMFDAIHAARSFAFPVEYVKWWKENDERQQRLDAAIKESIVKVRQS